MALEMILNELSLQPADDIYTARKWMEKFIYTVKMAKYYKVGKVIRTHSDIFDMVLAEDYPMRRWLNDRDVDREARRYVNSLITKAPFWNGLPDLHQQVRSSAFEYSGRIAYGLGIAYLLEGLALSLPSENCWDTAKLSLNTLLEENGEIETVSVIHASCPDHVAEHEDWIQKRIHNDIENGENLWDRRAELLPSLEFCEDVASQLSDISPTMLRPVVRRLFELETYSQEWTAGRFEPEKLPSKTTPESSSTLGRYSKERTFRCPDGMERVFSWHVRVTPRNWRIHFYPDSNTKTIIIGYIGAKLPTVKYH